MLKHVDLNLIQILDSLSQTESIKKTALKFSVSSSAISQSIVRLEEQLGIQLLLREHKQIRISPKGLEVLQGTRDSITNVAHFLKNLQIEAKSIEPTGVISVGCPSEFGASFLIVWFSELQKTYPRLKIKLRLGSPKTLLSHLFSGEVDFIIADDGPYYEELGQGFLLQRIFEEELIVCGSAKILADKKIKKDFHSLIQLPHLDYSADGSAIGIWYQYYFKKVPHKLELALVTENVRALITGVKHNLGIAMIPKYLVQKDIDKGILIEISPERKKLMNAYVLIQHQSKIPSKAEKVFMQMIRSKNRVIGE